MKKLNFDFVIYAGSFFLHKNLPADAEDWGKTKIYKFVTDHSSYKRYRPEKIWKDILWLAYNLEKDLDWKDTTWESDNEINK
tara:strand:- start:202 stop:447 length:246 start_codon:yes stop_codon:yes gene_type:complete